jgi:hypothetical protein
MANTWDVVNEVSPPSVSPVAILRIRRTDEESLSCCAATRGHARGELATSLANSAPIHVVKRRQRVASGLNGRGGCADKLVAFAI